MDSNCTLGSRAENGENSAEGLRYIKQLCSGMSGFHLYFIQNYMP